MRSLIEDIKKELDEKRFSNDELIRKAIDDAYLSNKKCNDFVTILDKPEWKENDLSILSGIPYAAKDLFSTKNILTTGSSNALKDYIPYFDATVIDRLKKKNCGLGTWQSNVSELRRGRKADIKGCWEEVPSEVQELLEKRNEARKEKNWALSDELRDKIKELGYIVKDSKDGATLEKMQ